jgi:hypothetical protein
MQAFSAVHAQHLRNAFVILADGLVKEQKSIAKTVELPFQLESAVIIPPVSAESVAATQLLNLLEEQEKTAFSLQSVVSQLAELTELVKKLALPIPVVNDITHPVIDKAEEVDIIENKVFSETASVKVDEEIASNCLDYFSQLPWGSEHFAEAAAKMREANPATAIPKIMQLATDSALKAATAQAELLSESNTQPSQNVLPSEFEVEQSSVQQSAEIETVLESIFDEESVAAETDLFQMPSDEAQQDTQAKNSQQFFQALPWSLKKDTQPLAEPETDLDVLFSDHDVKPEENLFLEFPQELQMDSQSETSEEYFQTLPWIEQSDNQVLDDGEIVELDNIFEPFFSDQPEAASDALFEMPKQEVQADPLAQNCQSYFQALPWMTQKPDSVQEQLQQRRAMLGAIFANKVQHDDKSFLQMLEEES